MRTPLARLTDLRGKTAIVTGGAMGIGLGIASRLAEAGASIVIADVNEAAGEAARRALTDEEFAAAFVRADAASVDDAKEAVAFAIATYGSLDILVNNAGIYPFVPVMSMAPSDLEKILAVNLTGAFLFTQAAAEAMIRQGKGGSIINITSIDALHPSAVGLAAYDASKHGLWGFTKNAALELAPHGIRVNAIAPGGIDTPGTGAGVPRTPEKESVRKTFVEKIPLKRMGEPDDIGKVALFLASDLAGYLTGAQIVVDGGVLLS